MQAPSTAPRCRLPLRSTDPIERPCAWHVHGCRAVPSAGRAHLSPERPAQYPCHHRGFATEAGTHGRESQHRYVANLGLRPGLLSAVPAGLNLDRVVFSQPFSRLAEQASIRGQQGMVRRQPMPAPSTAPRCRLPLRSTDPVEPPCAWHVHGCRAVPSAGRAHLSPERPAQYPCHHREFATEAGTHGRESQHRYVANPGLRPGYSQPSLRDSIWTG